MSHCQEVLSQVVCIPKWIYLIPDTFKFYKENIAELPYICIASLPAPRHTHTFCIIHSFINKHQSGNRVVNTTLLSLHSRSLDSLLDSIIRAVFPLQMWTTPEWLLVKTPSSQLIKPSVL